MNGQQLYRRARQLIPGGTQLFSKRPELYAPDIWPAYYRSAQGCRITDLDGRTFTDMSSHCVGACLLGYACEAVDQAVQKRIAAGSICSLNSPDEVELAERLLEGHPWAGMVRYARTGGEALAMAVRIARAFTGRDAVAFCGYHGWSDWYLAANLGAERLGEHLLAGLSPAGVPGGLEGTAWPFRYGDLAALQKILQQHAPAAIVIEPVRHHLPPDGFLDSVRQLADQAGAVLIVDEVSAGWKFCRGGAHLKFGLQPDLAVFAKAISNGYPMSVVVGRSDVMDAAQTTFLSSTYWTDGIGPAAALATLQQMQQVDLPGHLDAIGRQAMTVWEQLGQTHAVPTRAGGLPPFVQFGFNHPQETTLQTLFTCRMLDHGFLAGPQFYPTLAHTPDHVMRFAEAADAVFAELRRGLEQDDLQERLQTPVRQTGFQRLT